MSEEELRTLLRLLSKFSESTGINVLDLQAKVVEALPKTASIFHEREGVLMDYKMANKYDMEKMEENEQRYAERERNQR